MMMKNIRVYVERKEGFSIERDDLFENIQENFEIQLSSLRFILVYDIFDIDENIYPQVRDEILSEPNRDKVSEQIDCLKNIISYEYLPGQFDQRADSAMQCVKLLDPKSKVIIQSSTLVTFNEIITKKQFEDIKTFLINKVESREKYLNVLELDLFPSPQDVAIIDGFILMSNEELTLFHIEYGLAMNEEDLQFIQNYFKNEEKRDPYETEIRVLDTYWSDHCRHTTFETEIKNTEFSLDKITHKIEDTFKDYLETREKLGRDTKPITLMDLATINVKLEQSKNNLEDLEVSEEINAASIYIDVDVNGKSEKWLLMFKNETHNHPTEIEPFGGASTCIGGAIRDPLSGRSYVYSAMRVTGSGDITKDIKETLEGKLPQKVISKVAAHGYSSYGNQIGLATTYVNEIYHPGYVAKRMEIGAVIAAAPLENVSRKKPLPGDIVILLGGKTGRDGIGGATGSSKTHNLKSIETASAEVQKGNAPEERKIQRLFRNKEVTKLIKKSNDFGAGGVSVAIGELADGLLIDLNKVPTKYEGINGTELAISESQERMAVVIARKDEERFLKLCAKENIEAISIAEITKEKRLVMKWNNNVICDLSREFIDTSGVRQTADVKVVKVLEKRPFYKSYPGNDTTERIKSLLQDINVSSQQGLSEMFDSTIGRTTVFSPYGGKYQLTKTQSSVHKIPVLHGKTNTVSIMSYGFNPYISEWSQYHGSQYAIIESMAKNVAAGGYYKNIRFTFQEYFERLNDDKEKWAKPFTALLGSYKALKEFELAAIGGKDSMSGTYHELNVPPTLVSFAVNTANVEHVISNELKAAGHYLYLINHVPDIIYQPNYDQLKDNFEFIYQGIQKKEIVTAYALEFGGLTEALIKSTFGNKVGIDVITVLPLFKYKYGSILVESTVHLDCENAFYLGKTIEKPLIILNDAELSIDEAIELNQRTFSSIYPIVHNDNRILNETSITMDKKNYKGEVVERVNVLIPVFPGTNCEYDSIQAFEEAGAITTTFVFNNLTEDNINESIDEFAKLIKDSHILMLSGGFSSGDEPDGSGKFISSVLRNKKIKQAIETHLSKKRLILGICNGFQALVKSGLLPNGTIQGIKETDPTLFKNSINRHVSKFINTKVSSIHSPWLSSFELNDIHTIPMSHGEGKFIINEEQYNELLANNQIAFQYVNQSNHPTYDPMYNPNGSSYAIEGIVSKDGLILGKMGHSERYTEGLFKNIIGNKTQSIFDNAVHYFKGE
jgi:phosphoribosylformylglycinamidine synthase